MTDEQHLLVILAEEAAEVVQQASKAVRFGMDNVKPGIGKRNRTLLVEELSDLVAVASLLDIVPDHYLVEMKKEKITAMMDQSRKLGQL